MFFIRIFQRNKKSDHLKYPKNGVVVIDNIQGRIENNDFRRIPIGTIGGIDGWYIKMRIDYEDNKIYPFISCHKRPELSVRCYTSYLNKDEVSMSPRYRNSRLELHYGIVGSRMKIDELLDEKNEYLDDNGGLSIEYGIQVQSILGDDGIWKFNLYDKLFDYEEKRNMIVFMHGFRDDKFLCCHKQLLSFQTKFFDSKSNENDLIRVPFDINFEALEQCLQIAHGVRLQVSPSYKWFSIIKIAHKYSLSNVIHYCEQPLIEKYPVGYIKFAIDMNLNRYLAQLLKKWTSVEKLKTILGEYVEIDELNKKMSGEVMKLCVKYILENSK